jgi:hypothetical protein
MSQQGQLHLLLFSALQLPVRMINILDPARAIDTARLEVTIRMRRNPNVLPRRRNAEMENTLAELTIGPSLTVCIEVGVASAPLDAVDDQVGSSECLQSWHQLALLCAEVRYGFGTLAGVFA